jgi:hypothetical protein
MILVRIMDHSGCGLYQPEDRISEECNDAIPFGFFGSGSGGRCCLPGDLGYAAAAFFI